MEEIKNKIYTLTIGIPAFNEEANIFNMLRSIIRQKKDNYDLEKIIVMSDGSTDATERIVESAAKDHPEIILIAKKQRQGKAKCLNELYSMNRSDVFMVFDADLCLKEDDTIEKMINCFQDQDVVLASANGQPLAGQGFMEKVIVSSKKLWYEIRKDVRGGNNIYNCSGCASALRKSFVENLRFPDGIVNDQQFIYLAAKKEKKKFVFVKDAAVYYRAPVNLKDFYIQADHLRANHSLASKYFGNAIVKAEHNTPYTHKFLGLSRTVIKDPFYGILAVLLQASLMVLPERKNKTFGRELWKVAASTKLISNKS